MGLFGKTKAEKERIKKNKAEGQEKLANTLLCAKHITGLPIAEGSNCIIEFENDSFRLRSEGNEFHLSFSKITNLSIKTDIEIQKQYVSSAGGAILGAALFGPLGAAVGGRTKEKKITTATHYLIITYLKDSEVAYLMFDVEIEHKKADNIVRKFMASEHAHSNPIEL